MVQALIFDMDGTLVDSIPHHTRSLGMFCQRHGIAGESDDLMRRVNGLNGAESMRELFQRPLSDAEAWALIQEKEVIYRELFSPEFRAVAGVHAFAKKAASLGLKYGVGTAGDKDNIAFVFKHLQLEPKPLVIVGGDEGLPGKPEPAIFLEVANRLNVDPARCIVFEDAPFGIEAARRAGMRAVGICSTHSPQELDGPHVLARVPDFHALITSRFLESL